MIKLSFVEQHIIDSIRADVAGALGKEEQATQLRARSKLRLVCMSEREIWELAERWERAERTCRAPGRPVEEVYREIKRTIAEYRETADEWLDQVAGSSKRSALS